MKLLILLLSSLIGVQSETLEEVNRKIQALDDENRILQDEMSEVQSSTRKYESEIKEIQESIWVAGNQTEILENSINNVTQEIKSCQTTKSACLEEDKKTLPLENRFNEVKQEEERHRSELKALEDEQKNHPAKLDDLNRESNEIRNNSKLLEAELQELGLKLSKCAEESKYHKETNQSTVKEKTDGGGFINKIVTSTLDSVKQLKKGVANVLRSKINLLKFNIPE